MTDTVQAETQAPASAEPVLKLNFSSHATLESKDLARTRKFFEEFLGFEVVQMSGLSFWARMGGNHVIVVVQGAKDRKGEMSFYNHNGLDVATEADVDAARDTIKREAANWGLHKIAPANVLHGTYGFYFYDMDDNCWEILANPPGGYSWGFERGDQEGKGHMSQTFARPESTLAKPRRAKSKPNPT